MGKSLFEIYTDYRNGNEKAFDELFQTKCVDIKNNRTYSFCFSIDDLNSMVKTAYITYKSSCVLPYEKYKKYNENFFDGDEADIMSLFYKTLLEIFRDSESIPNEQALYRKLKYRICREMNKELENSQTAHKVPIEYKDRDGKIKNRLDSYIEVNQNAPSRHKDMFKKMIDIQRKFDISEMLPDNNVVARNIIQLIRSPLVEKRAEDYNIKIIERKEMAELYRNVYRCDIHDEQISKAYDTIYKLLWSCYCGNAPVSREEYIDHKKEGRTNV